MTTAADVQAKIDKLELNMLRLDAIINANSTTDVPIDSGTVPSMSKLITTIGTSTLGYVTLSQAASVQSTNSSVASKLFAQQFTGIPVVTTTNLQIRSEELDNAAYTKTNLTVSANVLTAPDGTSTADKVVETAATGLFTITPLATISVTGGARYTRSVFVKAAERSVFALSLNQQPSSNSTYAIFDLSAGTIPVISGAGNVGMENWGNGWYRCYISVIVHASATSTSGSFFQILSSSTDSPATSRAGTLNSGMYLWGVQFELTDLGPYAKTTTAPASANWYSAKHWADTASASITGVSTFNGRAGSVIPTSTDYTAALISYSGGTNVQAEIDSVKTTLGTKASQTDLLAAIPVATSLEGFWPTIPTGFLEEDGSAISRTTYANLFSALVTQYAFTPQTFAVTIASPASFTKTAHGFAGGERLRLSTTGTLPTGLANNVDYFVRVIDANTFRLATTQTNFEDAVDIGTSGTQAGTHSYTQSLFGLGDGTTTFNIPDSRNTFSATNSAGSGPAMSGTRTLGTQRPSQNRAHTHTVNDPGHAHSVYDPGHVHAAQGYTFTVLVGGGGGQGANGGGYGQISTTSGAYTGVAIYSAVTGITIASNGGSAGYPRHITRKRIIKY